jgi:hypothetical protein
MGTRPSSTKDYFLQSGTHVPYKVVDLVFLTKEPWPFHSMTLAKGTWEDYELEWKM